MATGLGDKLAVYIHRAKGSAEAAARAVNQALDDPEVFVFGELLDVESVKAVSLPRAWRVDEDHEPLRVLSAACPGRALSDTPTAGVTSIRNICRLESHNQISSRPQ